MLLCEDLDLLVVPKITCMDWITSVIHIYTQYIYTNVLTIYTIYIYIQYIYINYTINYIINYINYTIHRTALKAENDQVLVTRTTRRGKVGVELLRSVGDIFDKTPLVQRLYMCFF